MTVKPSFDTALMSAAVTFILLLSSVNLGYASGPAIATTTASKLATKFVRITVLNAQGGYMPSKYYKATQLVSLVSSIHRAVGNFNLVGVIQAAGNKGTPNPAATGFSDWSGNLDSFVSALKTASGGEIIAEANLDVYFGANDTCNGPQLGTVRGCPPCPSCFFNDAASLLKFSAIANGQRYLMLGSWTPGAFYAALQPNRTFVQHLFENLTDQGWKGFIIENSPPKSSEKFKAYDYGDAQYAKMGLFFDSSSTSHFYVNEPYIISMQRQEPYLKGHTLAEIATQPMNQTSAIARFTHNLNATQQVAALTALAANQKSEKYIFIYPVLANQGPDYTGAVWDANKVLQSNGQSFLSLITNLMNQYNS